MFVRSFKEVPHEFAYVEACLLDALRSWIPAEARAASEKGTRLLAEVGFTVGTRRFGKQVEVAIADPVRHDAKTFLPMTWRPLTSDAIFPAFEADLEVAPLGPSQTQVSVSARYRPPLGSIGRVIDRTLMHRVAEAIARDFLDRVCAHILEPPSRSTVGQPTNEGT